MTQELLAPVERAIAERRYDDAIRDARTLLARDAAESVSGVVTNARLLLGEALLAAARYDEARVEMEAHVALRPTDAVGHRLLGEALLRLQSIEPARAALRRAVELEPDDDVARDLLVEADADAATTPSLDAVATVEPTTEMAMPELLATMGDAAKPTGLRALLERASQRPSARTAPAASSAASSAAQPERPRPAPLAPQPTTAGKSGARRASPGSSEIATGAPARPPSSPGKPGSPLTSPKPGSLTSKPGLVPRPLVPRPTASEPDAPSPPIAPAPIAPAPIAPAPIAPVVAEPPSKPEWRSPLSVPPAPPPSKPEWRSPLSVPPAPPPERVEAPVAVARPSLSLPARARAAKPPSLDTASLDTASLDTASLDLARVDDLADSGSEALATAPVALDRLPPAPVEPTTELDLARVEAVAPPTAAPAPIHASPLAIAPSSTSGREPTSRVSASFARPVVEAKPVDDPADVALTQARASIGFGGHDVAGWATAPPVHGVPAPAPPPALGSLPPMPAHMPYAAMSDVPTHPGQPEPTGSGRRYGEPMTRPKIRLPSDRGEVTSHVRLPRLGLAAFATLLLVALAIAGVYRWASGRHRDAALVRASDHGARADVLAALDAEGDPAVRARLLATATVELGEDRAAAAEELLVDPTLGASSDARVARALLELARGQAPRALTLLEGLEASDISLAEAFRARALTLDAMGRHVEAREAAMQAWTLRPDGPRHACLVAREAILAGDVGTGVATLANVPGADGEPCVHAFRGLGALEQGELAAAETEANQVLGSLGETASASELAWAHYVHGAAAARLSDPAHAHASLRQALTIAPAADETLLLRALAALTAAHGAELATPLLTRLNASAPDEPHRAEVLLDLALERHDLTAAEAALATLLRGPLATTPRTALARGRLLEAQGREADALTQYSVAATEPALFVEASVRRARLLARLGRAREALTGLEAASHGAPADVTLASTFAHLALSEGDPRLARATVDAALRAHPSDPRLQATSALLRAALGEREAPLSLARSAAQTAPDDPDIRLDLAEIARRVGDRELERASCAEALRLEPSRFAAVWCAVQTELEAGAMDRATALLEEARRRGAPEPAFSRARAALAVAEGRGDDAISLVRGFLAARPDDVPLLASLATLSLQAEETRDADELARRVLGRDPLHGEALLVRAHVAYVDGHFSVAADLLDQLASEAGVRGVTLALSARITALRAMLAYEDRRYGDPSSLAETALRADPSCAAAHLVRALVARDPTDQRAHLEDALRGNQPPAEAFARLARLEGPTASGCALARRYTDIAPEGVDRRDIDALLAACP